MRFAFVLPLALLGAGCGYIGDIHPPLLDIPSRVNDLRAAEYGDRIAIEFTLPPLTTEGQSLKGVRSIELRVSAGTDRTFEIPPKDGGAIAFDAPAGDFIGKQVTLAVRATGPKGKSSEWSNPWVLEVRAPLNAPQNVTADNSPMGVKLAWKGAAPRYRIFRAVGEGLPARLGESGVNGYEDATTVAGTAYRYFVQAIDGDQHQSQVSAAVAFTPRDVFPPAVPAGLAGVPGVGAIELVWQRNTEEDFAGYNVFRAEAGGAFRKIAGPIDAPTYSDRDAESGKTYRYAVSSLDRAGNESEPSAPVEVMAP